MVLIVVLFFILLVTSSIATLQRRSTVDAMISRNRDTAARAAALARGGVRLATALLLEDRLRESAGDTLKADTHLDLWSQVGLAEFEARPGSFLRLRIEDSGARFNLNALFGIDDQGSLQALPDTEAFLHSMLERVISDMPLPPGEKNYDVRELAANLIDYVDADEVRQRGGGEDEYYQEQRPPYRAANRPLLSVEELRLVEGLDAALVEALSHYVTVYPYAPGGCGRAGVGCGVNLNTAPPHVLALLYFNDGVDLRLAPEDTIRRILKVRQEGGIICQDQSADACTPIQELMDTTNQIFPAPTYSSQIFTITAAARVGEIRRTVEAVLDRSQPSKVRLLSWRVR